MSILVNIIITICAFAAAVYAVRGNTTDSVGNLTRKGWFAIVIAAIAFISSCVKEYYDNKESKEKDMQINSLNSKVDSLNFVATNIDSNILNQKTCLFHDNISLGPGDTSVISFPLNQGMSIKILKQNCDNSVVVFYNNKPRRINDTDEEFSFKEFTNEKPYFENQNDAPCGIDFEIWGTLASFSRIRKQIKETAASITSEKELQSSNGAIIHSQPDNNCLAKLEKIEYGWALQLCSSNKCEVVSDTKSFLESILNEKLVRACLGI